MYLCVCVPAHTRSGEEIVETWQVTRKAGTTGCLVLRKRKFSTHLPLLAAFSIVCLSSRVLKVSMQTWNSRAGHILPELPIAAPPSKYTSNHL